MANLTLKNPHSILAALEKRPEDVLRISFPQKALSPAWERVHGLASYHKVKCETSRMPQGGHGRRGGREKVGREGSAQAIVREAEGVLLEELFADAETRHGGNGLWVALDCIQDPHNLGAIIRTAGFFGVQGILLTEDRAAPMSAVVYDTAAGGVEHVPFSIQTNLARSLSAAKEAGLWILGTSEHADQDLTAIKKDRPWLLVIGNETTGIRRLTSEHCDEVCNIPCHGGVTSLNASVAAGILIAHLA